jgi:hypothetical protein
MYRSNADLLSLWTMDSVASDTTTISLGLELGRIYGNALKDCIVSLWTLWLEFNFGFG